MPKHRQPHRSRIAKRLLGSNRRIRRAAILSLAIGFGHGASAQPPAPTLAVLPIKLLDTSAEPKDQSAEHRDRLAAMAADLASDLGRLGAYRTLGIRADDLHRTCAQETTQCLLEAARSRGARLVFVGVVHKSSTLIMQMWARIVDARTGEPVFSRELNFRGDNDESWRRAEAFLIDQIEAAPPPVPR